MPWGEGGWWERCFSVSGVAVCSPPEAASEIMMHALRAGKGVLCERLPSLNCQAAQSCFDEADGRGKPLVCGFYKWDFLQRCCAQRGCHMRVAGGGHFGHCFLWDMPSAQIWPP